MPPFSPYDSTSSLTFDFEHQSSEACHERSKGGSLAPPISKPKKSVTFNERVRAKKISHYSDFSSKENESCWYLPEDLQTMKAQVRFEANLLENGCLVEDENGRYCSRGLDRFTVTGSTQRKETKRRCRMLVLEEQELQCDEGSSDPAYIAQIYGSVSAFDLSRARSVALKDQLDALR